jgi:hypothetical protein
MKKIVAALLVLVPAAALAHHGWGGYDSTKLLKLSGTVKEANFDNPHGQLMLDADGKTWRVVLSPPARMVNRGMPLDAVKAGEKASVEGYQHKTDPIEMRAERLTVNGKTVELR